MPSPTPSNHGQCAAIPQASANCNKNGLTHMGASSPSINIGEVHVHAQGGAQALQRGEMRSGWDATDQLDWVGYAELEGVGARQAGDQGGYGGGGYQDECIDPELFEDGRVRELAEMGLPRVWLAVAEQIGYDNFMAMWRVLDAAMELRSDSDSMILVQLRRYRSFQRFQRNRYIESLAPLLSDAEIQMRVIAELDEKLHLSHIRRIARRRRIAA